MNLRWKIAQSAEWLWWKRYLRSRPVEEYLQWKRDYWLRFLHQISFSVPAYAKVLDAGCGPAGIFMAMPETVTVTALDPLLGKYEALAHFDKSRYPDVRFVEMPLEHLKPEDGCYDVVFCLNAINHVADIRLALGQLLSVAKPDATLVVSVDAHRHDWLKPIFRAIPGDILHPHQYSLAEYCAMIEELGWKVTGETLIQREAIFDYVALVCHKSNA